MKSLNQLKSRITWEIQTLRDRVKKIDQTRALRTLLENGNDEVDRRLLAERARIDDRIEALEALDKGRRSRKALIRRLAHVPALMRQLVLDDLSKVNRAANEVRVALGI